MSSITDWLGIALVILIPMTAGFFAIYNKIGQVLSDTRSLKERDDDHARRIEDHEGRLRRIELGKLRE